MAAMLCLRAFRAFDERWEAWEKIVGSPSGESCCGSVMIRSVWGCISLCSVPMPFCIKNSLCSLDLPFPVEVLVAVIGVCIDVVLTGVLCKWSPYSAVMPDFVDVATLPLVWNKHTPYWRDFKNKNVVHFIFILKYCCVSSGVSAEWHYISVRQILRTSCCFFFFFFF